MQAERRERDDDADRKRARRSSRLVNKKRKRGDEDDRKRTRGALVVSL